MRLLTNINKKPLFIFAAVIFGFNAGISSTVLAATSSSTSAVSYRSQFGSAGTGNGQFSDPYASAVNQSTGNIYVVDDNNSRVEEFTSGGTYITQWGSIGTGNSQFEFAVGIAVNQSTGNVYVADANNSRVQEFTSNGTYITQWGTNGTGNGQFSQDYFLAINQTNGTVYVVDPGNNRVELFTSNGTYISQFGSAGSGNGQFGEAFSIAVNDASGNVYVTDALNNTVQEFTSNGTYITQWGSTGNGNSQFTGIFGIAVDDSTGTVYVSDVSNSNVQAFTSNGTYISQFGSAGSGNGQFDGAWGIAINQLTHSMFVNDANNSRVEQFAILQNLAQETALGTTSLINLTLPAGSNITSESIAPATVSYANHSFPLGLLSYSFQTANNASGATVPIQISFQTNLLPSQVTPQVYNPNTHAYTPLPGATVTQTTVNGKPALLLSYSITDGGSLDEDGTANGVIIDPVGLAAPAASPQLQAPATGYGLPRSSYILSCGLFTVGLLVLGVIARKSTANLSRN